MTHLCPSRCPVTRAPNSSSRLRRCSRLQVAVLSARRATGLVRHPMLVLLHFAATGLMALGVGAIYWRTGRDTGGIQVGGGG